MRGGEQGEIVVGESVVYESVEPVLPEGHIEVGLDVRYGPLSKSTGEKPQDYSA